MGSTVSPRRLILLAVFAAILSVTSARAEDSNRNEVRASLERDGWSVIWGKNFTEADWARGIQAIEESIVSENPGPFLAWFSSTMDENFVKIQANMQNVTRRDLERWILESLKAKQIIMSNNLRIEAGFATYNRWQRTVHHEPRWRGSLIDGGFEMVEVENKIPLPNWHQFYIRYKLVGVPGTGPSKIVVTFTNDAPYGVDFFVNGSGPLSRPLRLERGQSGTFNLVLASGFSPYVRIRQPNGSYQDFSLPLRDQRYRFQQTPQNQVVNAFE
jgi:hypothetical protein